MYRGQSKVNKRKISSIQKPVDMAKLVVRNNLVTLKYDGEFIACEIFYNGYISGESKMPTNYTLFQGSNKILILKLGKGDDAFETLFSYEGRFKVISAKLYIDKDNYTGIEVDQLSHKWKDLKIKWENLTDNWESLSVGDYDGSMPKYNGVVSLNHNTEGDEFYYIDGKSYSGSYHYVGKINQYYTGDKPSEESEKIYMRDAKMRLVMPNKGYNGGLKKEIKDKAVRTMHNNRKGAYKFRALINKGKKLISEQKKDLGYIRQVTPVRVQDSVVTDKKVLYDGFGKPIRKSKRIKSFDEIVEKEKRESSGKQSMGEKTSDTTPTYGGGGGD